MTDQRLAARRIRVENQADNVGSRIVSGRVDDGFESLNHPGLQLGVNDLGSLHRSGQRNTERGNDRASAARITAEDRFGGSLVIMGQGQTAAASVNGK